MRDPNRIDRILGKLRAFWGEHPDLRLGQIVSNVAAGKDPFYMEDDTLEAALPTADPWSTERPTSGMWWLSLHPDRRLSVAVQAVDVDRDGFVYNQAGEIVEVLGHVRLLDALWLKRETPADPFEVAR